MASLGYVFFTLSSDTTMNTSRPFRTLLAFGALLVAFLSSGCHSPQKSSSLPIAPNWYDSYYYRDGRMYVPEPPDPIQVADPLNY